MTQTEQQQTASGGWRWVIKMAWRDSRGHRLLLGLFMLSVVFGIGAMGAILSLRVNLLAIVDQESRNLLGADLSLQTRQAAGPELERFMNGLGGRRTDEIRLRSMARFPGSGGSQFVQIRGIGGPFPFYGQVETDPLQPDAIAELADWTAPNDATDVLPPAIIEQALMQQNGLSPGDLIQLGDQQFEVRSALIRISGESEIAGFFAPRVYIPLQTMDLTGLLQEGSIARYRSWFAFPDGLDAGVRRQLDEVRGNLFVDAGVRTETVADRRRALERVLGNLLDFLNLIGFTALLLGGVGIAGAVQVYLRQKLGTLAVLRCIGVPLREAFMIYLVQVAVFGMIASVIGTLLGVATQFALPVILQRFLPFEINVFLAPGAILPGLVFGWLAATLFALLPLLSIRKVSPLAAIRAGVDTGNSAWKDPWRWVVVAVITVLLLGFALASARKPAFALAYVGALGGVLAVLAVLAAGLRALLRRAVPASAPYTLRLAMSNLYRPNNRTLLMLVTLGMGVFLLNTLYLARAALLDQVQVDGVRNAPNVILLDVQDDQTLEVTELAEAQQMKVHEVMPIITMRVEQIKGRTMREWRADPDSPVSDWVYTWEFRNTYRDHILDNATLIAGEFQSFYDGPEPFPISLSENVLDDIGVTVGDRITWNVQGIPVETVVSSIRSVQWQAGRQNFNVVFPLGTIESAPTTFAIAITSPGREQTAALQASMAGPLNNVSLLDLSLVFDNITQLLDRAAFVVQFMAAFTLATGLSVLAGTVLSSRYQRMLESVLLRTLGARVHFIRGVLMLEFAVLGALAILCGGLLSIAGAWGLLHFVFELPLRMDYTGTIALVLGVLALTIATGWATTRGLVHVPPLVILRKER